MVAVTSASRANYYAAAGLVTSSPAGRADLSKTGRTVETGGDTVEFSKEALARLNGQTSQQTDGKASETGENQLTPDQQQEVKALKSRDTEVRAHEQAHIMAGGSLVRSGASYQYKAGPDGKRYAVGGEVQIDTSPIDGDPRATIRKAQQIQKAASAPAEPSSQDRSVAAEAAAMELKAMRELAGQSTAGQKTSSINLSL